MRCDPQTVYRLLMKVFHEADMSITYSDFARLTDYIEMQSPDGITVPEDFLYRNLFLKSEEAMRDQRREVEIRRVDHLDTLARFIGYKDFLTFAGVDRRQLSSVLVSCAAHWYYYARDSSGQDILLRSPVRMWQEGEYLLMTLQGGRRLFRGQVQLYNGGLFCQLVDEKREKQLQLVFKIGLFEGPELLQGTFSGFSSGGYPVAGRCFLWRQPGDLPYDELAIDKLDIRDGQVKQRPGWPPQIIAALKEYCDNYVKVIPAGFDLKSL